MHRDSLIWILSAEITESSSMSHDVRLLVVSMCLHVPRPAWAGYHFDPYTAATAFGFNAEGMVY